MNTFRVFVKYVALNILGMMGLSCYILADTYFVAKGLGMNGLASLNLAISIYSFIQGAGLMAGVGGAARYGILKARGENLEADRVFTHTILFGLGLGLLFAAAGIWGAEGLTWFLGADAKTFSMTQCYLTTILCFSPCFILNNIFLAFIRNDKEPGLSMAGMLAGSLSNIALDYLFLFPLNMGIFGAAFATGLAPIISMGVLTLHWIRKKAGFRFQKGRIQARIIKDIVIMGFSAFLTECSSGIVLVLFNLIIVGIAGREGVAAYGVIANLALVAAGIFTGISQGIQPLISSCHGKGNRVAARKTLSYGLILAVAFASLIYILVNRYAGSLVAFFNEERNALMKAYALEGIGYYFLGFFFAGVNITFTAYLSAAEKPGAAFLVSAVRGFLAMIPLVILLSFLLGMKGVWISYPGAEAAAFVVLLMVLGKNGKKERKSHKDPCPFT